MRKVVTLADGLHIPNRSGRINNDDVTRYVISRLRNLGIPVNWNTINAFATNNRSEIAEATGSVILS